jgi:hypothetical protein
LARHSIKSFSISTSTSGSSVRVKIETDLNSPYNFELFPDENYPTVQGIEQKLHAALDHCVKHYQKADFNIFPERSYITIKVKDFIDTRFTGKKL